LKKIYFEPGFRDRVLQTISDPNIAYILMMIGLAGLYFELAHPGAIFPGVIGAISLILAFFSFQTLPVNYAGLLLIILAIIFFIAEIKVASYGILSIGGLISLTIGSIMLFEDVGVSIRLMMPTILLVGGFFVVVAGLAFGAYRKSPKSGSEGLLGEVGTVVDALDPEGLIFVHGEYWKASASERIDPGEKVEVVGIKGLDLKVKKTSGH
ncbi:MAG: nodulation protein NfeD, partial [Deltaproteobacteria bacterium]|nr:nodulation protein NfeD [Deltaproteobacteria bacterium]